MVPVRVFEWLGAEVDWWGDGRITVTSALGAVTLRARKFVGRVETRFSAGNFTLPAAPRRGPNGAIYVPLRAVAERLGWTVQPVGKAIVVTPAAASSGP
jgi:hypothetical protein